MNATTRCLACRAEAVQILVDFGAQPPSNRFEHPRETVSESHPLMVGQCADCGLIQLVDPMPAALVVSRFEWLTYNEPEGHLDDLVSRLCRLPGLGKDARILGLSYKDDTTLARFNRLGYRNTYRYQPGTDLGIDDSRAGLESLQAALTRPMADALVARHGQADLLLVRHVLEHAHDPLAFLAAVSRMVRPDGYLLFEMPDCVKFIRACDYCFVWEEHITYLSRETLATLIGHAGLTMQDIIVHPYPLEDSLIGIVRNRTGIATASSAGTGQSSVFADGAAFSARHARTLAAMQATFGAWRDAGKRVAIFGAGHLAAKFVNMYRLRDAVECVIDDNAHKQALLMPGSRLPIRGSAALDAIDLCLLALNPESEQRVLAKHAAYLQRGGRFLSIFALSSRSIYAASAP